MAGPGNEATIQLVLVHMQSYNADMLLDTLLLGTIRQLTEFGSILSFPTVSWGWEPNLEHEVEKAFLATHIAINHVPSKYVTKLINSGQIRSCNFGCFQGSCTIEEEQKLAGV